MGGWPVKPRRAVAVGLAVFLVAVPVIALAASATVTMGDATVEPGETTTVPVVLASAPDGLSGYNLTVAVSDTDLATVEGATYPDALGYTAAPAVAADGSAVRLEAVDLDSAIQPGATDVTLAFVEVAGREPGDVDLSLSVTRLDDDDGSTAQVAVTDGTVAVRSDATEPPASDAGGEPSADGGNGTTGDSRDGTSDDSGGGTDSDGGHTATIGLLVGVAGAALVLGLVLGVVLR